MAEILNRLATLQAGPDPSKGPADRQPAAGVTDTRHIMQLEQQLQDVTQKRLDYLENMQQQYISTQVSVFLKYLSHIQLNDYYMRVDKAQDWPKTLSNAKSDLNPEILTLFKGAGNFEPYWYDWVKPGFVLT